MRYRSEIDGLRALAIIPVIFYHAGFGFFSGGFVGVDIFFVISGYLITTILVSQLQAGDLDIVTFYERRARRILPALFLVIISCLPAAFIILYHDDFMDFTGSVVSVAGFISNFYFWRTSQYFDTSSEFKPLIHTWSLAVEEQYYIVFPIFLGIFWRFGRRAIVSLVVIAGLVSLALAHWGSSNVPTFSFYMLPTRFWELLLGSLIAFYFFRTAVVDRPALVDQFGGMLGLMLISYSIVFFDRETPFPSLFTVLPAIGASCVIVFAHDNTAVGRLLSLKPIVGIGLISYSAYLWHQPLFAFSRQIYVEEPSTTVFILLFLLAMCLAYVSWKYIERPFRQSDYGRRFLLSAAGSGLVLLAAVGALLSNVRRQELTPEQQDIYASRSPRQLNKSRCFLDSSTQSHAEFGPECGGAAESASILIWGDSHAAALSAGLRELEPNLIQYTASHCPPIFGKYFVTARFCEGINAFVLDEIARRHPSYVIVDAYWHSYGRRISSIGETLAAIKLRSPSSNIVLAGNVPLWPGSLPMLLLRHKIPIGEDLLLALPLYSELKSQDERLRSAADSSGAIFLSVLDLLCASGRCRATSDFQGRPSLTTFDYGHLSESGAVFVAEGFLRKLSYLRTSSMH